MRAMAVSPPGTNVEESPAILVEDGFHLSPIHRTVWIFLFLSTAVIVPMLDGTVTRIARWTVLLLGGLLVLGHAIRHRISRQGIAWSVSAVYGIATVVYSIDVPATVLRGLSFLTLTILAFSGGSLCYRETI